MDVRGMRMPEHFAKVLIPINQLRGNPAKGRFRHGYTLDEIRPWAAHEFIPPLLASWFSELPCNS